MDEATPNADEVLIAYLMQEGTNRVLVFLQKLKIKIGDDEWLALLDLIEQQE